MPLRRLPLQVISLLPAENCISNWISLRVAGHDIGRPVDLSHKANPFASFITETIFAHVRLTSIDGRADFFGCVKPEVLSFETEELVRRPHNFCSRPLISLKRGERIFGE